MKSSKRTLGLISSPIVQKWGKSERSFGYEAKKLLEAGRDIYGEVALINPMLVSVELPRGEEAPSMFHDGRPMPRIDSLILRSTARLGRSLSATIRALALLGCDILDPVSRTGGTGGSKLVTSIKRFSGGVGSSSYLAFSLQGALELAQRLAERNAFPLIAKPIAGSGGKGVVSLNSLKELTNHINRLYAKKTTATLLLQPFEEFQSEFRVVVFFGRALGIARKIAPEGSVAANAAQGGTFVPVDRPDVVEYVVENTNPVGILGVDVAQTAHGEFHIIESNRSPRWEEFDRALEMDTAREIVKLAKERLDSST